MESLQFKFQQLKLAEILSPPIELRQFPQLPPELRIIIWAIAANFPRKINLRFLAEDLRFGQPRNNAKVPSILHTCRESRKEALRYYQLIFEKTEHHRFFEINSGWVMGNRAYLRPSPRIGVYINFSVDSFSHTQTGDRSFTSRTLPSENDYNFRPSVLRRMRHLEFEFDSMIHSNLRTPLYLLQWKSLVDVTLAVKNFRPRAGKLIGWKPYKASVTNRFHTQLKSTGRPLSFEIRVVDVDKDATVPSNTDITKKTENGFSVA